MHSLLKKNWQISATFCDDNLQQLVRQHLEPVLQNIDHETSYEYVLSVIGDVESQYWDCALGPAAGEVYQKHLVVCNTFNTQTCFAKKTPIHTATQT